MKDNTFYLGAKGSVVAINRADGIELWRTPLKGSGFVMVVLDGDVLLAHTRGEIYGVQPETGQILWKNGLEGLGYGHATLASPNIGSQQALAVIQQVMADEESSQSTSVNVT